MSPTKEKRPKAAGFNYKEQHAVVVKVSTEEQQKKVFEQLQALGFTDLKIVSV